MQHQAAAVYVSHQNQEDGRWLILDPQFFEKPLELTEYIDQIAGEPQQERDDRQEISEHPYENRDRGCLYSIDDTPIATLEESRTIATQIDEINRLACGSAEFGRQLKLWQSAPSSLRSQRSLLQVARSKALDDWSRASASFASDPQESPESRIKFSKLAQYLSDKARALKPSTSDQSGPLLYLGDSSRVLGQAP
jgi:hypothetical protein